MKENLNFEGFEKSYSSHSVFIYSNFVAFITFFQKKILLAKNPFFVTPNFRTFWRFLLIQSHSTSNLLIAAILERIFFSDNASDLFLTKTYVLNSLRNFTNSVAFYSKFTTLSNFSKKNTFSSRKTHIYFLIKPNFESFENSYFLSRTLRQICYLMRIFVKITVFFRITHLNFSTEAIFLFFERFEKSYFFSRILRQICYF